MAVNFASENPANRAIDDLLYRSCTALAKTKTFTQEQVDKITKAMCEAGVAHARFLAELAVEETRAGRVDDKVAKNQFCAQSVYDFMKEKKSVGVLGEADGLVEIGDPYGVVAAVTPTTSPTAAVLFLSLIALKGRNVIVFAFHPRAQKCSAAAAKVMLDAAVAAGAPPNCIQWIEEPSAEASKALFSHPDVNLIVASAGGPVVKAALKSGHPSIGVEPGNAAVFIEKSADLEMAVDDVMLSKTFDNGTICCSDDSLVFDEKATADKALKLFEQKGAYLCSEHEKEVLEEVMFDKMRGIPSMKIVGKSPQEIAGLAGIQVPADCKLLMVPLTTMSGEDWMSHAKLSPVLSWYLAEDTQGAMDACQAQMDFGGFQVAAIFTQNEQIAEQFALNVRATRIIWNQPTVQGAIGGSYNSLAPSLTLAGENLQFRHLLKIRRLARRTQKHAARTT